MAYLVGIVGGTCSGKTTLLNSIRKRHLGDATFIGLADYFALDAGKHPLKPDDWKNPGYLLLGKLVTDLQKLRTLSSKLVIVEGFLILCTPELRSLFDMTIYIDLPTSEMLQRRLTRTGNKPWDQLEYIKGSLSTLHKKYVLPQRQYAQHRLDGRESREILLAQALELIHANITRRK